MYKKIVVKIFHYLGYNISGFSGTNTLDIHGINLINRFLIIIGY